MWETRGARNSPKDREYVFSERAATKAEEAEEQKERYLLSARQRLQLCLGTTLFVGLLSKHKLNSFQWSQPELHPGGKTISVNLYIELAI